MGDKESRGKIRRPWGGSSLWDVGREWRKPEWFRNGRTEDTSALPLMPQNSNITGELPLPQSCMRRSNWVIPGAHRWRGLWLLPGPLQLRSSMGRRQNPSSSSKEAGSSRNESVLYRSCYREWLSAAANLLGWWPGTEWELGRMAWTDDLGQRPLPSTSCHHHPLCYCGNNEPSRIGTQSPRIGNDLEVTISVCHQAEWELKWNWHLTLKLWF